MSETDSFIDEVSEELRRDRLFGLMRRYGWIAVLIVVLIVAGAAWNEWRKAQDRARAEALGDALVAALDNDAPEARVAALEGVEAEGEAAALVALLTAGETADGAEMSAETRAALEAVAADATLSSVYSDLAALKLAMAAGTEPDAARALLEPLTAGGAPYRVLAEEQLALLDLSEGETEAALARLQALLQDAEATAPLRERASALIVALGAEPDA